MKIPDEFVASELGFYVFFHEMDLNVRLETIEYFFCFVKIVRHFYKVVIYLYKCFYNFFKINFLDVLHPVGMDNIKITPHQKNVPFFLCAIF